MTTSAKNLSILLSSLIEITSCLNESDLDKIISGSHGLELKVVRLKRARKAIDETAPINLGDISRKLEKISDRSIAENFLKKEIKSKRALEKVARHLEVAVSKKDKIADLISKIIDSTVGARLRTAAIRGDKV